MSLRGNNSEKEFGNDTESLLAGNARNSEDEEEVMTLNVEQKGERRAMVVSKTKKPSCLFKFVKISFLLVMFILLIGCIATSAILLERLTNAQLKIEELQRRIEALETNKTSKSDSNSEKIANLEELTSPFKARINNIMNKGTKNLELIEELQNKMSHLQDQITKNQVDSSDKNIDEFFERSTNNKISAIQKDITSMKQKESELDSLFSQINSKQTTDSRQATSGIDQVRSDLLKSIQENERKIDECSAQLASNVSDFKTKTQNSEFQINSIETSIRTLQSDQSSMNQKVIKLENDARNMVAPTTTQRAATTTTQSIPTTTTQSVPTTTSRSVQTRTTQSVPTTTTQSVPTTTTQSVPTTTTQSVPTTTTQSVPTTTTQSAQTTTSRSVPTTTTASGPTITTQNVAAVTQSTISHAVIGVKLDTASSASGISSLTSSAATSSAGTLTASQPESSQSSSSSLTTSSNVAMVQAANAPLAVPFTEITDSSNVPVAAVPAAASASVGIWTPNTPRTE